MLTLHCICAHTLCAWHIRLPCLGFVSDLIVFSLNTTYKGEAGRGREGEEKEGGREGRVYKERVQRLLLIRCCVCFLCDFFFLARSSLTLSLSRDSEVGSRDSHRDKGWKTGNCFSLLPPHRRHKQEEKTSTTTTTTKRYKLCLFAWGGGVLSSALPSACAQLTTHCVSRWRGRRETERWTTWSGQARWLTRRGWWSRPPGEKSTRTVMMSGWPY